MTLSLDVVITLFVIMILGAALPGISSLSVAARAATLGFNHGMYTAAGIVVGDIMFILIALTGLSILAASMDNLFVLFKYAGGTYILWIGLLLLLSRAETNKPQDNNRTSILSSFIIGLVITLADQKAILFYLALFPSIIQLSGITAVDTGIILIVTIVAVGTPKLGYALLANRASTMFTRQAVGAINKTAGCLLVVIGFYFLLIA